MAFVDEIEIHARAGKGGDGVVRWRHEKGREFGGPSGGNGGNGGNVYVVAVRDTALLGKYRMKKEFVAEDGKDGMRNSLHGSDGDDLDILLPIGSVITRKDTKEVISLDYDGQREILLEGGKGGRGNESYKSSKNQSPEQSTPGVVGDEADYFIELELIADIGLIGLPSAGKSTMLNALTRANAKTAAYHFTTLEPNLGVCFDYVLVDIPGLIEGAAEGRGLGHKFLRHIKRTRMLAHLVSLENDDPLNSYHLIRSELERYNPELIEKPEVIVITKTDIFEDEEKLAKIVSEFEKIKKTVFSVTFYDDESIKELRDALTQEVAKLKDVDA